MWVQIIKPTKVLGREFDLSDGGTLPRIEVPAREAKRLIRLGAAKAIDWDLPTSKTASGITKATSATPFTVIRRVAFT